MRFLNIIWASPALTATPVEKVVELLNLLQSKIEMEGKEEQKTYEKFQRFCKEETAKKDEAITNGKVEKGEVEANLEQLEARKGEAKTRADECVEQLTTLAGELKEEKARRKDEHETWKKSSLDLSEAIMVVGNAVDSLQASKIAQENARGAFLQKPMNRQIIRKAALLADALGFGKSYGRIVAFLDSKEGPDPNMVDYEFHSGEIIELLKGLRKDLVDERQKVDEAEAENKKASGETVLLKKETTQEQQKQLTEARETISTLTGEIGQGNIDHTNVSAKLTDDEKYLEDLTKHCEDKSATWDQRVKMREEELAALHEATTILSDTVATSTTDQTVRLIQEHQQVHRIVKPEVKVSLIQEVIRHHKVRKSKAFLEPNEKRDEVADLLRTAGLKYNSAALSTLASAVMGNGTFKKIIDMIEKMVVHLQEEAAEEQDHDNWCKKQTGLAKQQRDIRSKEVTKFNQQLEQDEARRDQLKEEIKTLEKEIGDLEEAYGKAKQERADEKVENQKAVDDANLGLGALKQAQSLLNDFYEKKAANAKVGLVQYLAQEFPGGPDAGFKNNEAYGGDQGGASGILGMLEVIQSDFQRTIDDAKQREHDSELAFTEMFDGENQASQDEKNKLKETADTNLTETVSKIGKAQDSLRESAELRDKSLAELRELHNSCVATEMSYEERVARREDEIQSLKDALQILEQEGPGR